MWICARECHTFDSGLASKIRIVYPFAMRASLQDSYQLYHDIWEKSKSRFSHSQGFKLWQFCGIIEIVGQSDDKEDPYAKTIACPSVGAVAWSGGLWGRVGPG
jgi:hypothetical protein